MKAKALPIFIGLGTVAGIVALATQGAAKDSAPDSNANDIKPPKRPKPRPPAPPPAPGPTPPPAAPPAPLPGESKRELSVRQAHHLAGQLLTLEARYGIVGAKGKEDKKAVEAFQRSTEGEIKVDGKAGPATMIALAGRGIGTLPLVFYWPNGADAKTVLVYRAALESLASKAISPGLAAALRESAKRENGQGGIVGPGPDVSPTKQTSAPTPKPAPAPPKPPAPNAAAPTPAPAWQPDANADARKLALHLVSVETAFPSIKAAKGKEDRKLVKAYQKKVGLVDDGMAGPATMLHLARQGVGALPLVFYWPKTATAKNVTAYRDELLKMADRAINPALANALRVSAAREKGQAGIIGNPPPNLSSGQVAAR